MNIEYSTLHVEIPEPLKSEILEYCQTAIRPEELVEPELLPHITIKYGIDPNVTTDELVKAIGTFIPIRIMFGATKVFPAIETRLSDVLYIEVFGMSLNRIRSRVEANVKTVNVKNEYIPHLTLGYLQEFTSYKHIGGNPFIGRKVVIDRIIFSPLMGDNKIITCKGDVLDYETINSQ